MAADRGIYPRQCHTAWKSRHIGLIKEHPYSVALFRIIVFSPMQEMQCWGFVSLKIRKWSEAEINSAELIWKYRRKIRLIERNAIVNLVRNRKLSSCRIWSPTQLNTPPPPPSFTFGRGRVGGGEPERRLYVAVIVLTAGSKYQHAWLYLKSINSIKHQ